MIDKAKNEIVRKITNQKNWQDILQLAHYISEALILKTVENKVRLWTDNL